jgi:hypothetical protein
VPAAWSFNELRCGTPTQDTVIVWPQVIETCRLGHEPRVDTVALQPLRYPVDDADQKTASRRSIDGHAATQTSGVRRRDRMNVTVIGVADLAAAVVIATRDARVAQHISNSARVVANDAHACASKRNDTDTLPTGRMPVREDARNVLAPRGPAAVSVCAYDQGGFVVGSALTSSKAARVAQVLDTAPAGGSIDRGDGDCRLFQKPSYVLTFTYAIGPPVSVFVRFGGCGALGASNGSRVSQRTDAVIDAVLSALGNYGGAWPGDVTPIAE